MYDPFFYHLTDPDKANITMGIRKIGETDVDSGLTTFSEDTLKIDITRLSVCYLHYVVHNLLTDIPLRGIISRSSMSLESF